MMRDYHFTLRVQVDDSVPDAVGLEEIKQKLEDDFNPEHNAQFGVKSVTVGAVERPLGE